MFPFNCYGSLAVNFVIDGLWDSFTHEAHLDMRREFCPLVLWSWERHIADPYACSHIYLERALWVMRRAAEGGYLGYSRNVCTNAKDLADHPHAPIYCYINTTRQFGHEEGYVSTFNYSKQILEKGIVLHDHNASWQTISWISINQPQKQYICANGLEYRLTRLPCPTGSAG